MKLALLLALALGLLVPAAAPASLKGTVGPGSTITLTKDGAAIHKLKPGHYVVKVADKSDEHNFHLKGPGVNKKTSVADKGTVTWKVSLKKGSYTFLCDVHPEMMVGHFSVK